MMDAGSLHLQKLFLDPRPSEYCFVGNASTQDQPRSTLVLHMLGK